MARSLFDRDTAPGAEPEDLLRLDIPALIVPGRDAAHATSAARYLEECLPRSQYWDVPVAEQTEATAPARIMEFLDAAPTIDHGSKTDHASRRVVRYVSSPIPRAMRRNAAIGGCAPRTRMNLFGATLPSFSAWLLPWVRVTAFSCRRTSGRHTVVCATPGRLVSASLAASLNAWSGGSTTDDRAHPMVGGIDARRRDAFLRQRPGRPHQSVPCHDDAVVGGDQVLLGAIADRTHALLQRGVLDGETGHSAERPARLLRRAIDQIVVVLVGERPIGPRDVLAVHAGAVTHGIDLAAG